MAKIRKRMPRASPRRPEARSIATDGSGEWSGAFALPTLAGPPISERTALGISAVWNAVNIYAGTIAGLDLYVAEKDPRGGRRPAVDHPCYDLVHSRPNASLTSFAFRQAIVCHALTHGNGYAEIERNAKGRPIALHLLDPRNVAPRVDDGGNLSYRLEREGTDLPAADVVHVRGLSFDGIRGYGPIAVHRESLGLAAAQQTWESALYGNGAQPLGHLEIPDKLTSKQKQEQRNAWNRLHQGAASAGKVGILDGGMRWVQTSFSPEDAQLILGRGFSIAEVARIFNIPQHMLGLLEHATFSNIEQQVIQFYQFSLMPWLTSIEQELNVKLFGPIERARYFVRHDAATLLRGDTAAQTAHNREMFAMGAKSVNEVRLQFGLNPIDDPNADKHFIPVNNLAALEDLGTLPAPETDPDEGTDQDPTEVAPEAVRDAALHELAIEPKAA